MVMTGGKTNLTFRCGYVLVLKISHLKKKQSGLPINPVHVTIAKLHNAFQSVQKIANLFVEIWVLLII
jgi:hypothetical protein